MLSGRNNRLVPPAVLAKVIRQAQPGANVLQVGGPCRAGGSPVGCAAPISPQMRQFCEPISKPTLCPAIRAGEHHRENPGWAVGAAAHQRRQHHPAPRHE